MSARLTPKQRLFVANYLVHYNASRAVKQTYGDNPHPRGVPRWHGFEESARARGHKLLTNVHVSEAIRVGQLRVRQKFEVDEDMVVAELASVAFTRLDHIAPWDEDGSRLTASDDISPMHLAAVKGMKFKRTIEVEDGPKDSETGKPKESVVKVESVEFTMHDKTAALKLLGSHLGMRFGNQRINVEKGGVANVDNRQQSLLVAEKLASMTAEEILAAAMRMPPEPEDE